MNGLKKSHGEEHFSHTKEGELPLVHTHADTRRRAEHPRESAVKLESIYDIQKKWQRRGADVRLAVSHKLGEAPRLEVDFIGIPKASRCKGYGSKMMKELTRAADSRKMDIVLTPESPDRSERSRKFFERHGFKLSAGEDGPFTWMARKLGRRMDPKGPKELGAPKEMAKPKPTSLFMENAKKFKGGDKEAFSNYGGAGKIDHCASGSKVSYGMRSGDKEQEKRPPRPKIVPAGHFISWNEEKKDYDLLTKEKVCGGVVFNDKGEILLRMPAGHCDGYVWTFPKGKLDEGETPEEAAQRRVEEKTGVKAEVISEIPGTFEGDRTVASFYVMRLISENHPRDKETAQVAWVKPEEAQDYILQTVNETGRERDVSTLDAAINHALEAFEKKMRASFSHFERGHHDLSIPVGPEQSEGASAGADGDSESDMKRVPERIDEMECPEAADIRNALIYWGQKEHRAKYSPKEQREILGRILAAAQKRGIEPESLREE